VNFAMTEAEVIAAVNAALATGDRATMLELASELDRLNNSGCSIDAHGRPGGASGRPNDIPGRPNR
jgi:hypothetical protein